MSLLRPPKPGQCLYLVVRYILLPGAEVVIILIFVPAGADPKLVGVLAVIGAYLAERIAGLIHNRLYSF